MLALCEAFHQLPSAVLEEDAGLLRMLRVRALGTPAGQRAGVPGVPSVEGGEGWS